MKDIEKITINTMSIDSINRAEKRKLELENKGYTLVKTMPGFAVATLIYQKATTH